MRQPKHRTSMQTGKKISTGDDYRASLLGRNLTVFLLGQRVPEPSTHPIVAPSVNAVAETYDLALREPELASAISPFTGEPINRFLHIATSAADLVRQNQMQRKMGQNTGTCFQRCVGMDAFNALFSTTFDMDAQHKTGHHARFTAFLTRMHRHNYVIGGAMTDVKGDRSKAPHEQADPDLFVHITRRRAAGGERRPRKRRQMAGLRAPENLRFSQQPPV